MSFVGAVTALSDRVLRDRTFELIVAPAIADLQHDDGAGPARRLRNGAAVLAALGWGVYEDATSDADVATFAGLTLIPACYYTLLIAICAPRGSALLSTSSGLMVTAALVLVLSLGPAIACYWPERRRRATTEPQ